MCRTTRVAIALLAVLCAACGSDAHVVRAGGPSGPPSMAPGSLGKEVIRRVIESHSAEVRVCYERGLATNPDLHGRIVVMFIIAPTGRVQGAALHSSDMGAPEVEQCIVETVKTWTFPAPAGNGIVVVNYPFTLVGPSNARAAPPRPGAQAPVPTSRPIRFAS